MKKWWSFLIVFLVTPAFGGCLEPEDNRVNIEEPSQFDFGRSLPATTWYHYGGTLENPWPVDATDSEAVIIANITVKYFIKINLNLRQLEASGNKLIG